MSYETWPNGTPLLGWRTVIVITIATVRIVELVTQAALGQHAEQWEARERWDAF